MRHVASSERAWWFSACGVVWGGVVTLSGHGFAAVGEITPQSIASAISNARQAAGSVGFRVETTRVPAGENGQWAQQWVETVVAGAGRAFLGQEYTVTTSGVGYTTGCARSVVDGGRYLLHTPRLGRAWVASSLVQFDGTPGSSGLPMATLLGGWDVLGAAVALPSQDDIVAQLQRPDAVLRPEPVLIGGSVCVVVTTSWYSDGSPAFEWAFDVARNFAPAARWYYGSTAEGSPLLVSYEVSEFFDAGGGLFLPAVATEFASVGEDNRVDIVVTQVLNPSEVEALLASADNVPSGTTVADLDSGEVWIASNDIEGVVDQALAALPADARHAAARWPVVEILAGCAGVGLGLALWGGRRRSTPR
jgi:hypothetical protein